MYKKWMLFSIMGIIFVSLIVFSGCEDKSASTLTTTVIADDGEAPNVPTWLEVQPQYLFTDEDPTNNKKYFAVYLRWRPVTTNKDGEPKHNIVAYKIYRDNTDTAIGVVDYGDEMYEDRDLNYLTEGKRITYYISAVDSAMRETLSGPQIVDLITYGVEPQPPMNFYVIPNEGNQITLSWDEPENALYCKNNGDAIGKYRIERRVGDGRWRVVSLISSDRLYYVDDGLVPGKIYYYRVYAVTRSGNVSLPSDERSIVLEHHADDVLPSLTAPENVRVNLFEAPTNPYALKISWSNPLWNDDGNNGQNPATDVIAYRVYRAESTNYDMANAYNLLYKPLKIVYNNYSYIDDSVDIHNDGKYYYYRIAAINSRGIEGDKSYPVTYYNGRSTTSTNTPEGFKVITDNQGNVTFYWTYNSDVEVYYIFKSKNGRVYELYKTVNSASYQGIYTTGDELEYKDNLSLSDNDIYYFKLSAYDEGDSDTRSNMGYYVKAEKPVIQVDNRIVLQAEDFVNSAKVRSVWYAWYSNELFPNDAIADNSLWQYDLRAGEHYILQVKEVFNTDDNKSYTCLYFDPMGTQHPPQVNYPSSLFMGISDEVSDDGFVYTDLIDNNVSNTLLDEQHRVVYPTTTSPATSNRINDSIRPILKATSRLSSEDYYNYFYISTYNDDGLSYWQDLNGDGVSEHEFYYMQSEWPLLQHGMEGDVLKLDYDVDPWTNEHPSNFASYRLNIWDNIPWNYQFNEDWYQYYLPYFDFWYLIASYRYSDFVYSYWYSADRTIDNWPNNNYSDPMWIQVEVRGDKTFYSSDVMPKESMPNGGCAYFIGPDSNTKFMARDYLADSFKMFDWAEVYPINWRENYFGPLYSNTNPYYVGWWPSDAYVISYSRSHRKDNSLTFNEFGRGVDYTNISWINPNDNNGSNIIYNTYDLYQEQFKISWTPNEDGYYDIKLYFIETTHSGNYMIVLKQGNNLIGVPSIINLSEQGTTNNSGGFNDPDRLTSCLFDAAEAKDGGFYRVYLRKNIPLEFVFCSMGSNYVKDVFSSNYSMSMESVFELYLDRIEIIKR